MSQSHTVIAALQRKGLIKYFFNNLQEIEINLFYFSILGGRGGAEVGKGAFTNRFFFIHDRLKFSKHPSHFSSLIFVAVGKSQRILYWKIYHVCLCMRYVLQDLYQKEESLNLSISLCAWDKHIEHIQLANATHFVMCI